MRSGARGGGQALRAAGAAQAGVAGCGVVEAGAGRLFNGFLVGRAQAIVHWNVCLAVLSRRDSLLNCLLGYGIDAFPFSLCRDGQLFVQLWGDSQVELP